jgi:hypothetical protein
MGRKTPRDKKDEDKDIRNEEEENPKKQQQ